jgi:hypothetical protein
MSVSRQDRKEVAVAYSWDYPGICSEGLNKKTKTSLKKVGARDSNRAPLEHKLRALFLDQTVLRLLWNLDSYNVHTFQSVAATCRTCEKR